MKKVYLITSKSFYDDFEGVNHQIADYGCMPSMFSSLKRAKECLQGYLDQRVDVFNEVLTEERPALVCNDHRLIEEFVTISKITGVRTIISLWCDWIY